MILVYSALRDQPSTTEIRNYKLRYQAYLQTCEKYRRDIAAIRKYLPGWTPAPPEF